MSDGSCDPPVGACADDAAPAPLAARVTLTARGDTAGPVDIKAPSARRGWIDDFKGELAEQGRHLAAANSYGWEVVMPCHVAIDWNGGRGPEDLAVRCLDARGGGRNPARSIAGEGIVTFDLGHSFDVPDAWNLLLAGPHNNPKRGIAPLAQLLDGPAAATSCSISWMMTTVGTVVFEQGEPFCLLLLVPTSNRMALS